MDTALNSRSNNRLEKRYGCPVELTLEVIGGKWKCVILWWLRHNAKRFSELMQLIPGMTQKVLTQQLRELEADGLIQRQVYREVPPRVEYSLTPQGETLRPITDLMCDWGKAQLQQFQSGLLRLEGLHILLLLSTPILRERLQQELSELRGATVTAVSLDQNWAMLNPLQPDLAIVELTLSDQFNLLMPEAINLKQATFPTIGLIDSALDRSHAFVKGIRVVLRQPVDIAELTATIASLTSRLATIKPSHGIDES